jgi:hypothetical protein
LPPLRREKCGFSDAAAAQELDCIANYSKLMPTRIAESKFMILLGFRRPAVGLRNSA